MIFDLSNHAAHSQQALMDIVQPVMNGLRRCGVKARLAREGEPMSDHEVTVFAECFDGAMAEGLATGGKPFGLICTEKLTNGVMNDDHAMERRRIALMRVIPHAKFIWYFDGEDYAGLHPRASRFALRFDQDSVQPLDPDAEPQVDFTGYGTFTEPRAAFCRALQARGFSVTWERRILHRSVRDAQVRAAKWVIDFPGNHGGRSHSREWAAIHLRRPLCAMIESQTVTLVRQDWRVAAAHQLQWYAGLGSMEEEMRRLIVEGRIE